MIYLVVYKNNFLITEKRIVDNNNEEALYYKKKGNTYDFLLRGLYFYSKYLYCSGYFIRKTESDIIKEFYLSSEEISRRLKNSNGYFYPGVINYLKLTRKERIILYKFKLYEDFFVKYK